jgi:L-threonylcarbamoyladenylate synthase
MRIVKTKNEKPAVREAVAALKNGGLVICPTETCYIPAVDATNPEAVKKLLAYKGERKRKPISVAMANMKMAKEYVEINETAKNLYQNFLPGPLTVVSKSRGKVIAGLEGGAGTLGIRIPDYPLTLKIIKELDKPITSTSANTSGRKTPYSLGDILKYTSKKKLALIDLFLDAGRLPLRPTSTVVDTTLNEPKILRQGEIVIADVPGQVFFSNSEEETKQIAGQIFGKYKGLLVSQALIFALQGELGSGKTQFIKGLGRALKISANIPSPTFFIIREYPYRLDSGPGKLFHIDTWKMEKGEELLDLGLGRMLKLGNILAIEWLQKIKSILEKLPKKKIHLIWVTIKTLSETRRKINYQS